MTEIQQASSQPIIAVDLDGTLTLTDTLHESAAQLVRDNPLYLFVLPFWLMGGKAQLKAKVAERVELDVSILPYNQDLIDYLKEQKAAGSKLVLCTATNERIARSVAEL